MTREISDLVVWIGLVFLTLGSVITLITAIGIVHFKSIFARMHSAAKPQSFGLALMAIGVTCVTKSTPVGCVSLLVVILQYLTAPISTHMLGRAAFRSGRTETDETLVADEYLEDIRKLRDNG